MKNKSSQHPPIHVLTLIINNNELEKIEFESTKAPMKMVTQIFSTYNITDLVTQ